MKSARFLISAAAIVCGLLGLLATASPSAAQCVPDPPTGSIVHRCDPTIAARPTAPEPEANVSGVAVSMFVRNPIVSMLTWYVAGSRIPAPQGAVFVALPMTRVTGVTLPDRRSYVRSVR